jgi:hypothetical protein
MDPVDKERTRGARWNLSDCFGSHRGALPGVPPSRFTDLDRSQEGLRQLSTGGEGPWLLLVDPLVVTGRPSPLRWSVAVGASRSLKGKVHSVSCLNALGE